MKIYQIDSSARKEGSTSRALAKKLLEKDFKPITDTRATQEYRMEVAKNLLEKCFFEVKQKKTVRINS